VGWQLGMRSALDHSSKRGIPMRSWFTFFIARVAQRSIAIHRVIGGLIARKLLIGLAVLILLITSTSTALVLRGRAEGATPLHVWLHYDYLVGAPDGHNDAPNPAALQLVVDAFKAHGIMLEIDNHHNEIPWKPYISLAGDCRGADTLLLSDVKAQYFHPISNHNWDYVLFGDRIRSDLSTTGCSGSSRETGEAWLGVNDFVIAMSALDLHHLPWDIYRGISTGSVQYSCTNLAITSACATVAMKTRTTSRTTSAS
jgi:hypothetical protein